MRLEDLPRATPDPDYTVPVAVLGARFERIGHGGKFGPQAVFVVEGDSFTELMRLTQTTGRQLQLVVTTTPRGVRGRREVEHVDEEGQVVDMDAWRAEIAEMGLGDYVSGSGGETAGVAATSIDEHAVKATRRRRGTARLD